MVIGPDLETHLELLEEVLERLRIAGFKLMPPKCELLQRKVKFLGHIVSVEGVATDLGKVSDVESRPTPRNIKELKAFLGTVAYYHLYIEDFATIAHPLTRLTCKDTPWDWDPETIRAFQLFKDWLTSAPILGYPDPKFPYILDKNSSNEALGAVLSQVQEGKERVIAFYSKTMAAPERNYCVTRKELLAIVTTCPTLALTCMAATFSSALTTRHSCGSANNGNRLASGPLARYFGRIQIHGYNTRRDGNTEMLMVSADVPVSCVPVQSHREEGWRAHVVRDT